MVTYDDIIFIIIMFVCMYVCFTCVYLCACAYEQYHIPLITFKLRTLICASVSVVIIEIPIKVPNFRNNMGVLWARKRLGMFCFFVLFCLFGNFT